MFANVDISPLLNWVYVFVWVLGSGFFIWGTLRSKDLPYPESGDRDSEPAQIVYTAREFINDYLPGEEVWLQPFIERYLLCSKLDDMSAEDFLWEGFGLSVNVAGKDYAFIRLGSRGHQWFFLGDAVYNRHLIERHGRKLDE